MLTLVYGSHLIRTLCDRISALLLSVMAFDNNILYHFYSRMSIAKQKFFRYPVFNQIKSILIPYSRA